MVDGVGGTHYAYNAVGQILSENGPFDSDTVNYSYFNRLRTGLNIGAPNASAWAQGYAYDTAERLTGITSPAGSWIFPSPQRGDREIPAKSFRESHKLARDETTLPHIGFHDCRHYFISRCAMSGVDYMTIDKWVGRRDGAS